MVNVSLNIAAKRSGDLRLNRVLGGVAVEAQAFTDEAVLSVAGVPVSAGTANGSGLSATFAAEVSSSDAPNHDLGEMVEAMMVDLSADIPATFPNHAKATVSDGVIIVRTPVAADREPVRALCKAMHARTIFGDIAFSDAKFDRGFDDVMAGQRHKVGLVAELNGRIIGAASASAGEYFIGEGTVLTTVHFIAVDHQLTAFRRAKCFLRLIKGIRMWSATRNAKHLLIHVSTGHTLAATDRLLKAAGMKIMGGGYVG